MSLAFNSADIPADAPQPDVTVKSSGPQNSSANGHQFSVPDNNIAHAKQKQYVNLKQSGYLDQRDTSLKFRLEQTRARCISKLHAKLVAHSGQLDSPKIFMAVDTLNNLIQDILQADPESEEYKELTIEFNSLINDLNRFDQQVERHIWHNLSKPGSETRGKANLWSSKDFWWKGLTVCNFDTTVQDTIITKTQENRRKLELDAHSVLTASLGVFRLSNQEASQLLGNLKDRGIQYYHKALQSILTLDWRPEMRDSNHDNYRFGLKKPKDTQNISREDLELIIRRDVAQRMINDEKNNHSRPQADKAFLSHGQGIAINPALRPPPKLERSCKDNPPALVVDDEDLEPGDDNIMDDLMNHMNTVGDIEDSNMDIALFADYDDA
ncbi:hypothetical protein AB1K70_03220 [Bremerella sp. JC770]|uniref:hypothetical protein n=1 Tax=Bremerella sp. JC770 TaxID=3232137 RepID=UPI003457965E